MNKGRIVLIDADALQRKLLKNLLIEESVDVLDFASSMGAIQWIKKNGSPAGILIEEHAKPLNAIHFENYLKSELQMTCPLVVISNAPDKTLIADGIVQRDYKQSTGYEIKKYFCKHNQNIAQKTIPKSFSLNYLEEIYESNNELIIESLKIFVRSVEEKITEMQSLLTKGQFEQIRGVAHNIKPSFEMVNNPKAKELCRRLVYESEDREMAPLVKALYEEYSIVKNELVIYIA